MVFSYSHFKVVDSWAPFCLFFSLQGSSYENSEDTDRPATDTRTTITFGQALARAVTGGIGLFGHGRCIAPRAVPTFTFTGMTGAAGIIR